MHDPNSGFYRVKVEERDTAGGTIRQVLVLRVFRDGVETETLDFELTPNGSREPHRRGPLARVPIRPRPLSRRCPRATFPATSAENPKERTHAGWLAVARCPCRVGPDLAPRGPRRQRARGAGERPSRRSRAVRRAEVPAHRPAGQPCLAPSPGVPGDPDVYYAGAASGGIFKTTDGGVHWKPVFDDQPVSSIGSLAVAPSDPNVVWAGTGETFIRSNISLGNGIYKSTDAGKTWKRAGLENTGRIGRIVVDPRNPDVVFACALGHAYGPQQERGVFRTTDGGKTWERVLFVDENTGCSDLVMDPNNPRILFAGMWQMVIKTWGRESGGPGSGLYVRRRLAPPGSASRATACRQADRQDRRSRMSRRTRTASTRSSRPATGRRGRATETPAAASGDPTTAARTGGW